MTFVACRFIIVAVCLLGLLGPASAQDQKKADPKKSDPSEPKKEKLLPAGSLLAEIIEVNDGGKMLKIRLHTKVPEIKYNGNQGGWRPGPRPPAYTVGSKNAHEDVDLVLAEDVKVRIPFKPEIDEKTKRVKPESIRPDPSDPDRKLGGAKGTEKDLQPKQWVAVTLGANKEKPPKYFATAVIVVGEEKK